MKNTYFTVDIRSAGYGMSDGLMNNYDGLPCSSELVCNARQSYNTGMLLMYRYMRKNIVFLLIADSNDGITDKNESNGYIFDRFGIWIDNELNTCLEKGSCPGINKLDSSIRTEVGRWNEYMFNRSLNGHVMGASIGIVIIIHDRYIVLQAGDNMLMSCIKGRRSVAASDAFSMLGRHSRCNVTVRRGRIGYGDILLMCSICGQDDITMWYVNTLLRKRYGFSRMHGRGISCRDINECVVNTLCSRGAEHITSAALCCERSVI